MSARRLIYHGSVEHTPEWSAERDLASLAAALGEDLRAEAEFVAAALEAVMRACEIDPSDHAGYRIRIVVTQEDPT